MARKANIAREEIHQACWDLLEQNQFPNIPRVADYFLNKDGRHGSNTTLMNAIAEWEESYKEYQQHQLKELDDTLQPIFNQFSREVTQTLGKLLDEKLLDVENQQTLKEQAARGGYLSLSASLCEVQSAFDSIAEEKNRLDEEYRELKEKQSYTQQRYDDVASHNHVLDSQLKLTKKENDELQINLSQSNVDLAKLDNKLSALENENEQLKVQIQILIAEKRSNEESYLKKWDKQIEELTQSVAQIRIKDRDPK